MVAHLESTLTCPHCGQSNTVTTANLPAGTRLACSRCLEDIARWRGAAGFVALAAERAEKGGMYPAIQPASA